MAALRHALAIVIPGFQPILLHDGDLVEEVA